MTTVKNKETKTHINYHAFLVTSLLISSLISVTKPCSLLTSINRQANSVMGPLYPGYLTIGAPTCLVCSFNRLNMNILIHCGTQQHCTSNLSIVRPSLLCYTSSQFYWRRLTLISAWISNQMLRKVGDEITYTFPSFNGCTVAGIRVAGIKVNPC